MMAMVMRIIEIIFVENTYEITTNSDKQLAKSIIIIRILCRLSDTSERY